MTSGGRGYQVKCCAASAGLIDTRAVPGRLYV